MDIQQYISSGIIEACALGKASAEDMRKLLTLSAQYPEIKKEWEEAQETLEDFANLHAVPPPDFLKEKIWEALNHDVEDDIIPESNNLDFSNQKEHTAFLTPKDSKTKPFYKYLVAASLLFLIGSVAINLLLWDKNKEIENKFSLLNEEKQKEFALNKEYQSTIESYQKSMDLLSKPFVKSVPLAGVGDHSQYNALVIWDTNSKDVYLSLNDLPEPPKGKQYQLWGIVDGKPVDAGVYPLGNRTMQKMKPMENVALFAITLEDEGGVPSPTMDEMYVAGKS